MSQGTQDTPPEEPDDQQEPDSPQSSEPRSGETQSSDSQPERPQPAPRWRAGPFDIRLPFIHVRFEWPEFVQGLVMCAVDISAISLMINLLDMPFEVALAVIFLNALLYLLHPLLGDPVIAGWITPAIPLLMAYCQQFPEGPERVHALISFQVLLGLFAITLGITGLSRRVVNLVPPALKAGVLLGAGVAAVQGVFGDDGEFAEFPITISIAVGLAFFLMFSKAFATWRTKFGWAKQLARLGVVPCILLAVVIAPLSGEAQWPDVQWGLIDPDFGTLWSEYTVFGLGLPPAEMFLSAVPVVLACYIVVFGDTLQGQAVLKQASKARTDELVEYKPDRAHMIFGARNATMGIIGPDVAMAGPVWAAMLVVVTERYKTGKQAMQSIFGGGWAFRLGTATGLLMLPIVTLMEPIMAAALALTLLIQAYVSARIGMMEARSQRDLGIAGFTAGALALLGAGWGLAIGAILCILIYGRDWLRGEDDGSFTKHI